MTGTATSSSTGCFVSPSPALPHQDVVGSLYLLLRAACPPELKVILAPFDVALADDTVLIPDLLVSPRSQFTRRELPGPPLLAVEVLSPSTRRFDLRLKRDRLQQAGAASYRLIDPEQPSVIVLELRAGVYEQVVHLHGDGRSTSRCPSPCTWCRRRCWTDGALHSRGSSANMEVALQRVECQITG